MIKSVCASTTNVKETNDQYEHHIKMLEKVRPSSENEDDLFNSGSHQEVEKAKHEYHDLQKTIQQIATKTTSEKSKLEG